MPQSRRTAATTMMRGWYYNGRYCAPLKDSRFQRHEKYFKIRQGGEFTLVSTPCAHERMESFFPRSPGEGTMDGQRLKVTIAVVGTKGRNFWASTGRGLRALAVKRTSSERNGNFTRDVTLFCAVISVCLINRVHERACTCRLTTNSDENSLKLTGATALARWYTPSFLYQLRAICSRHKYK